MVFHCCRLLIADLIYFNNLVSKLCGSYPVMTRNRSNETDTFYKGQVFTTFTALPIIPKHFLNYDLKKTPVIIKFFTDINSVTSSFLFDSKCLR